jgi:hypothetical protein
VILKADQHTLKQIVVTIIAVTLLLVAAIGTYSFVTNKANAASEIEIYTIEGLNAIRNSSGSNYILMKDLDFNDCASYADCSHQSTYTTGSGWVPIPFLEGNFLGNGHTISNLYINSSSNEVGLFGSILSNAHVEKLGLLDVNIKGNQFVGGITGIANAQYGGLSQVYTTGSIEGTDYVGGIAGGTYTGLIEDVYSRATVTSPTRAGGVVGFIQGDATVRNAYSAASVSDIQWSGGAVGIYASSNPMMYIFNDNDLNGMACVSPATANANCMDKTNAQMTSQATFTDELSESAWNFSSIWVMDPSLNYGYPAFQWQVNYMPTVVLNSPLNLTKNSVTLRGSTSGIDGTTAILLERGFEYGTTTSFGQTVNDEGDGLPAGSYSKSLSGLQCATRYYYRAYAVGLDMHRYLSGTGTSSDSTFVTAACDVAGSMNDKNGDAIIDADQQSVATTTSTTGKTVTLELNSACSIDTATFKAEAINSVQDSGYNYDQGMLSFTADCGTPGFTTTVKQYFYNTDPANVIVRKYNPTTHAYFTVTDATITQQTVYGQTVTVVSFEITDGGPLDADGVQNGVIVDPVGLATQVVGVPNTGIGGRSRL